MTPSILHSTLKWREVTMRAAIVAVACVAFGFAVYQRHIFNIYHTQVQFVIAGITIGMAYAFVKANRLRDGVAALVVWYVVLVGLILHEHSFVSVHYRIVRERRGYSGAGVDPLENCFVQRLA